ncbi:MAG: FeoB small GTPase domain-containing protein [Burkholderiales bacterium]
MSRSDRTARVALRTPLLRGDRRVRIALVGLPGCGKSTLFTAVASTSVRSGSFARTGRAYDECEVDVGLDQARVIDLPGVRSLLEHGESQRAALKYLLWGDDRPAVSAHESEGPPAPYAAPDVIVHVVEATALERHLELTLELLQLGRPLVVALNRMDEARERGIHVGTRVLSRLLGVPVVPMIASMGYGIREVFVAAVETVRRRASPLPITPTPHVANTLRSLRPALSVPPLLAAFRVPPHFLVGRIAEGDRYFVDELKQHFPREAEEAARVCADIEGRLARSLREELHADRHHVAATLAETATRPGGVRERRDWRFWLDALFLSPRLGMAGSAAVFAAVLWVVFDVSAWLDTQTSARLVEWISHWQPVSLPAVTARAVLDGLIGLVAIVVPYMIPLVLLLIVLEQVGIMARIAFAVDRGFHRLGLHGGVSVAFLLGLGCNVPALSAISATTRGGERTLASLLVTFVPCSARSAIVLALAGKYLGLWGVVAVFGTAFVAIAAIGRLLRGRASDTPGHIQEIPSYALPRLKPLLAETWLRTRDILTVVTPLLIGGSVVLALLHHFGADDAINMALSPITHWWLGLPAVLGVPLLFGVLRKELSLVMIFQALGTIDVGRSLDTTQLVTFLLFLTLYVPCISTFAVMLKTIGRRQALYSVAVSVGVALVVSGAARAVLTAVEAVLT